MPHGDVNDVEQASSNGSGKNSDAHSDANYLPEENGDDFGAFGVSEDLVQSPMHKAAATGSIDFGGLLHPPLRLHEDLREGNGGQAWPAGCGLSDAENQPTDSVTLDNDRIELGAGGGLVGLAIALGCSPDLPVQITDQDPMVPLMRRNITLNGLEGQVIARTYNWGSETIDENGNEKTSENINDGNQYPDIVLAADCVYFEPAFPLLQQTLRALIGPRTICYFCFKRRRRADLTFLKTLRKTLAVEDVQDDPDREIYSREKIFLCTIRRKTAKVV